MIKFYLIYFIFCKFAALRRLRKLKSFLMEDKVPLLLYSQYHGSWWHCHVSSQGISRHGDDLSIVEYCDFSTGRVELILMMMNQPHQSAAQNWPWLLGSFPDSKVHGANMEPIWGRQAPGGPHVGTMNFAIWVVLEISCWWNWYFFLSCAVFHWKSGYPYFKFLHI